MTLLKDLHHEKHFHAFICDYLATHGWLFDAEEVSQKEYDRARAIYPKDVLAYIHATQEAQFQKLEAIWGAQAEEEILKRLTRALETHGTLETLRKGFNVAGGGRFMLCQQRPEDARNETLTHDYDAIQLRVVTELHYAEGSQLSIDLGFFINGVPVATAELKSDGTQDLSDAIWQYKYDRAPIDKHSRKKHPLLTFKRGAMVHFAISQSEIAFATKLAGQNTVFLPFNQGDDGRAGNPPASDEKYQTAYFWEEILNKDNLLRLVNRFIYVEKKNDTERIIFPRYHQWQAVNKLVETITEEGPGQRYLIQHSTGSGKTSSISWTCHELIRLRRADGTKYFDSVIVVTDRRILDTQLQNAIKQIDHQLGTVEAIDRKSSGGTKSKRLAEALKANVPVIIVTLQTFPFAMELIGDDSDFASRNYAVIVDEAHTSQTGTAATKLRQTLGIEESEDMIEAADILLNYQKKRQFRDNVSYLAFTATPKHPTLTLFGRRPDISTPESDNNLPAPFHLYSMQQAIEEGFILDVLKNYTTYSTALRLSETVNDSKRVDSKQASRSIAKWLQIHPTNISQKIELIVEHFKRHVAPLLDGQAKAMVVTGSRAAAVQYKHAFDRYIKEHSIENMHALVAFSGAVNGEDLSPPLPNKKFSEENMNTAIHGQDLHEAFDGAEYQVMIVANKFQTGFDQPKLVAMYVDKKLSGVDAVQTFSRLNRIAPKKDRTFILDFVNEMDEILDAFKKFYKDAHMEKIQDPNIVYEIKEGLDKEMIYETADVMALGEEISSSRPNENRLFQCVAPAKNKFNEQLKEARGLVIEAKKKFTNAQNLDDKTGQKFAEKDRAEAEKECDRLLLFKGNLKKFTKTYEYIAQIIYFSDETLEAFAAFAKLLSSELNDVAPENIDLAGLRLTYFSLKQNQYNAHGLSEQGENTALSPISALGSAEPRDRALASLQEIIERLNALFGKDIEDGDQLSLAKQVTRKVSQNETLVSQVRHNDFTQAARGDLVQAVTDAMVGAMESNSELANRALADNQTILHFSEIIYKLIRHDVDYPKK